MNLHNVKLIDSSRQVVAVAQLAVAENAYRGQIDLGRMPADLRTLFNEFEDVVNGQMFSLADEVEDKIASLGIRAVFDNGREYYVKNLQIFPCTGEVSLKLASEASSMVKSA